VVAAAGFKDAVIQRFGGEGANEAMIRTPIVGRQRGGERDPGDGGARDPLQPERQRSDLNQIGRAEPRRAADRRDPDGVGEAKIARDALRERSPRRS
jgi:hypothetical protein